MSKFVKRTVAPEKDNGFYYANNIFYKCGYGMPNCTAYAWGRFYELTGQYPKLSTANAENWYVKNDGYSRGQTPKLGAIACWAKGKVGNASDGAGHVAVVEEIRNDGTIVTSNSGWKSTNFYMKEIRKPYNLSGYTFQGFIYCPTEFEEDTPVQPTPPTQTFRYNVGDKVVFNGILYINAKGEGAGQSRTNLVCTITKRAEGSKPYNINNGLGWVAEEDLQPYTETTSELKVGDKVKIIGTGNGASDGSSNTAYGIGWEREILKIYDGRSYPYQVGNSSGTTGFYKASSLEKL